MRKIAVILFVFVLSSTLLGQEYRLSSVLPNPSIFEKDTIIDPFSLKKLVAVKTLEPRRDSIYEFDWSTGSSEWIRTYGTFHNYDEAHKRISTIGKGWISNPGEWQNNVLQEFFYDEKENRNKDVLKVWSISTENWINYSQRLFSYNDLNNLTSYILQKWDGIQTAWKNSERYLYDYDEAQNWIYYERQDWNPDSLMWEHNYRFIYTYETGLKKEMLRQNWNQLDSLWVNGVKNIYEYDLLENLIVETQYVKDSVKSTKISYTRDQLNQVTEKLYQAWIGGAWKNTTLYTYQYSSPGKESEYIYHTWGNDTWNKKNRHLTEYDESGARTCEIDQVWQTGELIWVNDYKWEYYFTGIPEPLYAYISDSTDVSCYGYTDGTATVTISGGTPPYSILWNDPQSTTSPTVFGLSANQYYTVTVTDAALNSVIDSVMLSEPEEIVTGPIYGEDNVNLNDTVTYWVESDTTAIYSWFVMSGQILSYQAGDSVEIIWTQPGNGRISVIESNSNGCGGDTVYLDVSVSSTGITDMDSPAVRIYPNPANQYVIIQLDERNLDTWDLAIYDMTGKIVRSFHSLSDNRKEVSLDGFGRGFYFFKLNTSSGIMMQKVVIER